MFKPLDVLANATPFIAGSIKENLLDVVETTSALLAVDLLDVVETTSALLPFDMVPINPPYFVKTASSASSLVAGFAKADPLDDVESASDLLVVGSKLNPLNCFVLNDGKSQSDNNGFA